MAQENFSITENSDLHFLFLPKGRKSPKMEEKLKLGHPPLATKNRPTPKRKPPLSKLPTKEEKLAPKKCPRKKKNLLLQKNAPHLQERRENGMRNEEEEPPFYTKLLPPWVEPTCIGGKQN